MEIDGPIITHATMHNYHEGGAKLWYFTHNIQMEQESDLVAQGKLTHEQHYTRDSKEIPVIGVVSEGNPESFRIGVNLRLIPP